MGIIVRAGLIGAAAALACCQSMRYEKVGGVSRVSQLEGDWVLIEMNGREVHPNADKGVKPPTMIVGVEGKVGGFAGVNRFTTMVDGEALRDGVFALTPIAATKMAGMPEAMKVEEEFLAALRSVDRAELDREEGVLILAREKDAALVFQSPGVRPE